MTKNVKAPSTHSEVGATHVDMLPVNAKETPISAKMGTHVNTPPILAKAGFTLAEVLITLGIIGVVAAMTIPNLMTSIQKKQLEQQIKVNYSSIQQTLRFSEDDGLSYNVVEDDNLENVKKWFDDYIAPHMKVERVCYNEAGCWHGFGVVKNLLGAEIKVWGYDNKTLGRDSVSFVTSKGAYYYLDSFQPDAKNYFGVTSNEDFMVVYMDANGDRKPNVVGKDIYIMLWSEKGLIPAGSDMTKEVVNSNCLSGDGYFCFKKLVSDGFVIDDRVWRRKK